MRRAIPLLCLALCLPSVARDRSGHASQDWSDVEHWAGVFDDPERDGWQKPFGLMQFLAVSRGDTVADVGAGTGYFTKLLSAMVGAEGKVYAVDTEQAMLDYLIARDDIRSQRVEPVLAAKNDPRLPDGKIDLFLVVNTWHHIGKRSKYLKKVRQSLSPEGRVAIVDFEEGDYPVGPPAGTKLPRADVLREFDKAGWRFVAESVVLPYQYVLVFLPPAEPDSRRFLSR